MIFTSRHLTFFKFLILSPLIFIGRQGFPAASYLLKGSLTGLLSNSSVRIKNGTEIITLSANGKFSFAKPLNSKASYSVSVNSNPTGQTCLVSNATGKIRDADVTNINVACSPIKYSLGGNITRLSGAIKLKNSAVDTLNKTSVETKLFSNNSKKKITFSFPNKIAHGSTYNVSVEQQPAGQNCTVTNASGTVKGANISNVSVSCTNLPAIVLTGTPAPTGQEEFEYSFTPNSNRTGIQYSIANRPSWAAFNPTTGQLSGTPAGPGIFSNIAISATDGKTIGQITPFTITVKGDPLARMSWHLKNTGQNAYARESAFAGNDLNVSPVIGSGITGLGVRIAVSDTGLDIRHEDLVDNVISGASRNYAVANSSDPTNNDTNGDHGTSVAGIIAMKGWNNLGGRGIAPNASIAGFKFLGVPDVNGTFILEQAQGDFDIFNQSWGHEDPFYRKSPVDYFLKLRAGVTNLRSEKGAIYLKAAGNDFQKNINSAFDGEKTVPYVIVVGATNARGLHSSYSSKGSNLWVSGLGGEYGWDQQASSTQLRDQNNNPLFFSNSNKRYLVSNEFPAEQFEPAILTADSTGCDKGYSRRGLAANLLLDLSTRRFTNGETFFGSLFQWDVGQNRAHADNPNCNYTATFNGTSSATPSVSGVVALMLERNPSLTWRDVKHILASTSTRVDPSSPSWTLNGAGYQFSNFYGFGRANAQAAVEMARTYQSNLGAFKETPGIDTNWKYNSDALSVNIPDNNTAGTSHSLNVTDDLIIEAVQIQVNVTHPHPGDIGIELVSPAGTTSSVIDANGLSPYTEEQLGPGIGIRNIPDLSDVIYLSNAFYGEGSLGSWSIRVKDQMAGNTGKLENWRIKLYGHRR